MKSLKLIIGYSRTGTIDMSSQLKLGISPVSDSLGRLSRKIPLLAVDNVSGMAQLWVCLTLPTGRYGDYGLPQCPSG